MRASKGGLTHEAIMNLTWRQFGTYIDAFMWAMREEYDDGKRKNRADDLYSMLQVPELKERKQRLVDDTNGQMAKIVAREEEKRRTGAATKGTKRALTG